MAETRMTRSIPSTAETFNRKQNMSKQVFAAAHESEVLTGLKLACQAGPTGAINVSGIIAYVGTLIATYGQSILLELPTLLASAGAPAWLVPLVVGIATALVNLVPKPAA